MKRSGFKKLSFEEALEKKKLQQKSKTSKPKTSRPVKKKLAKYPTIMGIKGMRYTGLKGVLWTIFSRYVRKRDFIRYHGKCVSCNAFVDEWRAFDAGHYVSVSRGNFATLFDEDNVHGQCKRCNNPSWTPDASIPFAYELDRRLGKGTADRIYTKSQGYAGSYSELEYMRAIEHFKLKFDRLDI